MYVFADNFRCAQPAKSRIPFTRVYQLFTEQLVQHIETGSALPADISGDVLRQLCCQLRSILRMLTQLPPGDAQASAHAHDEAPRILQVLSKGRRLT